MGEGEGVLHEVAMGGFPFDQSPFDRKGLQRCRRDPFHEVCPSHEIYLSPEICPLIDSYPLIDHGENPDHPAARLGVVAKMNTACPGGEVADGVLWV